jgi:hypothetical protein
MSIAGSSGRSYGIATLFLRGKSALDQEFRHQNTKGGLPKHRLVPDLSIFPAIPVVDSYATARDLLFADDDRLSCDRKLTVRHMVWQLRAETLEMWNDGLARIRDSLSDDRGLVEWFDEEFAEYAWKGPAGPVQLRAPRLGFDGQFLHLDAAQFGVSDVSAAASLCDRLLCPNRDGVDYEMLTPPNSDAAHIDGNVCVPPEPEPDLDQANPPIESMQGEVTPLERLSGVARKVLGLPSREARSQNAPLRKAS